MLPGAAIAQGLPLGGVVALAEAVFCKEGNLYYIPQNWGADMAAGGDLAGVLWHPLQYISSLNSCVINTIITHILPSPTSTFIEEAQTG